MKRYAPLITTTAAILVMSGCGGSSGAPVRPLLRGNPLGGQVDGTLTVADLRQELLAFADRAMGEMVRASGAALEADSAPATRAFVKSLQADVASTSLALAVEQDPEQALQDLMVSIAAHRGFVDGAAPDAMNPEARAALESSLEFLERSIWEVGEQVYPPAELTALRARLDRWQKAGGENQPPGVVRVADLPADPTTHGAMVKGLFAPLDEATRQLEESRLLGERFLFLAERLPVISLWQAEAMTWEIMAAPESRRALDGLTLMSSTLERLALRVDSLPTMLDDQREAFLSAFDEREEGMRTLLDEAGRTMRDASALTESGERVAALSTEAAASLNETLTTAERLIKSLRDADAPGGAMSFEIEEYTAAISDFRAATEALNAALETADGLSHAPRDIIDHAAWRAAQLIVLLFVLLATYRFGPALAKRRTDSQS